MLFQLPSLLVRLQNILVCSYHLVFEALVLLILLIVPLMNTLFLDTSHPFSKIIHSLSFCDFKLGVSHDLWILSKVKRNSRLTTKYV